MKNTSTGATPPVDCTDWTRVRAMTNTDLQYDADSPPTTADDWAGAVLKQGGRPVGRVRGPGKRPPKEQVAIRLSPEVLAAFRASGPGWQTRIDAALRDWLKSHSPA